MKKLIAISVMFALVAGAAFAQTAVSGLIETRFWLFEGSSAEGSELETKGTVASGYIQLSGQNADGNFGGLFRLRNQDNIAGGRWHRAFAWWRPIPQLRVFLGIDNDGMFNPDNDLVGWGFHQGPEGLLAVHDWGFWRNIFPGNWDGFGLAFSVTPMPGLGIHLAIPTGSLEWFQGTQARVDDKHELGDVYPGRLRLYTHYAVADIGTVFFTYIGPGTNFDDANDFGHLGLSFRLTSIAGLQAQLGFATKLPDENDEPVWVGLGVHYAGGDWGVKFRAGTELKEDYLMLTANVMPWYNFGSIRGFLDIGFSMLDVSADDVYTGFWVTPYLTLPAGPGQFQIGLLIYSNISLGGQTPNQRTDADVNFALPFRFTYSF